jgi:hypothetical protein
MTLFLQVTNYALYINWSQRGHNAQLSDMNAVRTLASKIVPVASRRALSAAAATPSAASFKETWAVGEVGDQCIRVCIYFCFVTNLFFRRCLLSSW